MTRIIWHKIRQEVRLRHGRTSALPALLAPHSLSESLLTAFTNSNRC